MAKQQTASPSYFVMTCEGLAPATDVELVSEWDGPPWMTGEYLTDEDEVPNPVIFQLDPDYPGHMLPMYESTIPLMRDDLIEALRDAGVDNLQLFPAVIREGKKREHTNYKAVNIVGLIACANMEESERMDLGDDEDEDDEDMIDVGFESLVIDESKAGGALLFRLAEAVSAIIVHKSVKDRVSSIRGMTFYGPGEWSG